MDVQGLALLLDQQAKGEIDARLWFTADNGGIANTTRNTVYAVDPLKDISTPMESMMTVPTDPPSKRLHLIGGHFFANGKLYSFPGMESDPIVIDGNVDTYVLTGVRIDPYTDYTSFYCETYYGEWPFMDPAVIPSALVKIPAGQGKILSQFIIDLRPFIHYNVSSAEDRVVVDVACVNPYESIAFSLIRNHRLPPIMNFYQKRPPAGTSTIVHTFDSMDAITVLTKDEPEYDADQNGIRLKYHISTIPVDIPTGPTVLVVSAEYGRDSNPGTYDDPMGTIEGAIDRLNSNVLYETIFVLAGRYSPKKTLNITRPVVIIGKDPHTCIFDLKEDRVFIDATDRLTIRTMQFSWITPETANVPDLIQAKDDVRILNCLFKQASINRVARVLQFYKNSWISNCVIDNPFSTDHPGSISEFYRRAPGWDATTYVDRVENCIITGQWNQAFISGISTRNLIEQNGDVLDIEDRTYFYPADNSKARDYGHSYLVGLDLDSSPTDTGLYGGQYASGSRVKQYSLSDLPVFKYKIQTMFSPVIGRFVNVVPIYSNFNNAGEVYGAISFDGGHVWVAWDEPLGAWRKISSLDRLDIEGNTAHDLAQRVINMGPIPTKGEICFAWGLKTTNRKHSPVLKGVRYIVKANGDSLVPLYPENQLSVVVAEDTVMVTNLTAERITDLVIVAY